MKEAQSELLQDPKVPAASQVFRLAPANNLDYKGREGFSVAQLRSVTRGQREHTYVVKSSTGPLTLDFST